MSKKIRVIWYKAEIDKHWLDNLISLWTWLISAKNRSVGPYSHVEIWTPDDGEFMEKKLDYHLLEQGCNMATPQPTGTCWTSTMRGKNNGTVSRPANTVIENVERWNYCEIELEDFWHNELIESMTGDVNDNQGYSKKDILRFFVPWHGDDKDRQICSEFVNDNLYVIGIVKAMDIPSPRRLAYKLKQAGYEIKPLADSGFPSVGNPTQEDIDNIVKEIKK